MSYTITNISNPGQIPQEGDIIKETYSDGSFVKKQYHPKEEASVLSESEIVEMDAKKWRNSELTSTDYIVPLTDFPNYSSWITYRQQLRDWPSTDDFPDIKPTQP